MSRLSRDDWSRAALEALAAGGVGAVAVEPIAESLGATKGSFYWHFGARRDLVESALALWEKRSTDDVIAGVDALGGTAAQRFRWLFSYAFAPDSLTGVDARLLSHVHEPEVRAVLDRVTAKRVDYLAALLREHGHPTREARRRAIFCYSAFLGHLQLVETEPDLVRRSVGRPSSYADDMVALMLSH